MKALTLPSLAATLVTSFASCVLAADDPASTLQALALISKFANEICAPVSDKSTSKSLEYSGEAKIKLDALFSKIADLGIGGSVRMADLTTQGILQKDLAQAYQNSNECRLHIFDSLRDRLLPPALPDPLAARMAGRWRSGDSTPKGLESILVVIRGNQVQATETDRNGRPIVTFEGAASGGVVDGEAFAEINPTINLTARKSMGKFQLQLSADGQHIYGYIVVLLAKGTRTMNSQFYWYRL